MSEREDYRNHPSDAYKINMTKHPSIIELGAKLRLRLGENAFQIVDHWDGDLCAIGIAHPRDPGFLVYVTTHLLPESRHEIELEMPAKPGSALPYSVATPLHPVDFEGLVNALTELLRGAPRGGA